MTPDLNELIRLAREAGEILRADYGRGGPIYRKGVINLVTDTDHESEAYIIDAIRSRYPGHRIVAEESGGTPGSDRSIWYIDPLDGTVNFAHSMPIFSVSIAYAEDGKVQYGVVYNPIHEECYTAERGRGAQLNGEPIHISNAADLDQALLVTGFPYDIRTNPVNNLDLYREFSLRSQGVRRYGSAALDLGYLACGRVDGYWEVQLFPWDLAAGGLIAEEAGAMVTSMDGRADFMNAPISLLAATPAVHAQMLEVIRSFNSSRNE